MTGWNSLKSVWNCEIIGFMIDVNFEGKFYCEINENL